jgi:hypothetical protein
MYQVFNVSPNMKFGGLEINEVDGYLEKFWIQHPELGTSLVKIDQKLIADSWVEKVAYELNKKLNIPSAQYEFGTLYGFENYRDGTPVTLSPSFVQESLSYSQGLELLNQVSPKPNYNIGQVIKALENSDIQLPLNYQAPEGIKVGADLFVGYLLLDSLIDNYDRHKRNWGYNSSSQDNILRLSPTYDHGVGLGVMLDNNDHEKINVPQYVKFSKSAFGKSHEEVFQQAAQLRPDAAEIWLTQLAKIAPEQIQDIFTNIPSERITPEASKFAQELLKYNQKQLLNLRQELSNELQQRRVNNIAPILIDYLQLNQKSKVENESTIVEYNPESKMLTYQNNADHQYLKARFDKGKWIDVGSNISSNKESQFVNEIATKVHNAINNQLRHMTRKIPKL